MKNRKNIRQKDKDIMKALYEHCKALDSVNKARLMRGYLKCVGLDSEKYLEDVRDIKKMIRLMVANKTIRRMA